MLPLSKIIALKRARDLHIISRVPQILVDAVPDCSDVSLEKVSLTSITTQSSSATLLDETEINHDQAQCCLPTLPLTQPFTQELLRSTAKEALLDYQEKIYNAVCTDKWIRFSNRGAFEFLLQCSTASESVLYLAAGNKKSMVCMAEIQQAAMLKRSPKKKFKCKTN